MNNKETELQLWKKQAHVKDVDLSKKEAEIIFLKDQLKKNKDQLELERKVTKSEVMELEDIISKKEVKEYKPVRIIGEVNKLRKLAVLDNNGDIVAVEWRSTCDCVTIIPSEEKDQSPLPGTTKRRRIEQLTCPHGVAITKDGHLLVTDRHRLQKLTTDGVCLKSVGSSSRGRGELEFDHPRGITVHPTTEQIFVAEYGNNRIQVLNEDLTFSHMITLHDDKLQLNRPVDLSVDNDGYLYIAESGNHCITKVTTTGEYIARIGSGGSAPGQLRTPSSIVINNNILYITELGNSRVSIFDTKGHFLHSFNGTTSGKEFNSPRGIAIDQSRNLYVSDTDNNRIVVYGV